MLKKLLLISLMAGACLLSANRLVYGQVLASATSRQQPTQPGGTVARQAQPLTRVLKQLEKQYGVVFDYNHRFISTKVVGGSVHFDRKNDRIEQVLTGLLPPLDLQFEKSGAQSFLIYEKAKEKSATLPNPKTSLIDLGQPKPTTAPAVLAPAERPIRGRVLAGDNNEGLPGVSVAVKGTQRGTTTDASGNYQLSVPDPGEGDAASPVTLVFSFVGYTAQEVVMGSQSEVNLTLEPSQNSLNEVVVVGYGNSKKVNLTGSVSTVDPKELRATPTPTVTQALMGRVSGVFIRNGNGQPGENKTTFNIRGFGQALIIIDGLPASSNDFNQLDPNDIENVSILKDAASAAVYGSRAGNGVVLVTTRRGGVSEAKFTYTANFGLQYFALVPKFVNAEQYARMENVSRVNQGLAPVWTNEQIGKFADGSDPINYPNTNWWNEALRTYAPQIQHNMNIQGGTEKIKYFVSGGYFSQHGLERASETRNNRYNIRSNLDVTLSKRLKLGLNLSAQYQTYYGSMFQMERTNTTVGIMTTLFRSRPYFLPQYPDPTKLPNMGGGDLAPTVLTQTDKVGYRSWNKLTGDVKMLLTYDLPFGFQARANFHAYRLTDQYKEKRKKMLTYSYNPATNVYTPGRFTNDPSRLTERNSVENNLNQQYFLTWNKTIGDHNINALAVYEILSNSFNFIEASRIRYDFDIDYLFAGPDLDKDNNGAAIEGGRKGFITRLNYDYKGKYLLELNSRLDASPKFPSATRRGFFPSASVGWRISEESFMRDKLPFISNLKLRASYGRLGYDDIGNFQYLQTYAINGQYIYDGVSNVIDKGIRADALANPSITWEKMTTSNLGLDFNLWGNKLEGSLDYFYRLRTDVLGARIQALPNVVGANLPQVNYARFNNRGVELTLNHRNTIRNLNYSVGGNISWNREKSLLIDQTAFASDEAARRGNRVGQWTDLTWGKQSAGLFQSIDEIRGWADQDGRNNATILPGDVKLIDYNGDGRITAEDDVIIGRGSFPKLTYGINLSASWKGLEMNMLWQGAGLYDINLRNSPDMTLPFFAGNTPLMAMLQDAYVPQHEGNWLPVNTNARWPLYRTDNYNRGHASYGFSDFWLIKGDYIRLKNIELGYTLPKKLFRTGIFDRCKVYVSGTNLLTFSALDFMDPEIDTSPARTLGDYYPPVGTYNAGILLQF